jgi:Leucine-rich repeat (LRR) protein
MDVKSSGFLPGRQYDDIPVSLVSDWASDGKPLILGPGKHSIRVAFIASPSGDDAGGPVRAVSNPVEIEITAEKIQWGQKVEGLQAGLVFDMQERPYRVGELVSFRLYVRSMGYKAVKLVDSVGVNPPRDDAPLIGWAPSVHDAAGKPLPVGMAPMDIPVLKRRRSLPAGETMLVGTVSLRLDSRPDRGSTPFLSLQPGTYRVSQKYRFADDPEATWSGELASGELELRVVAAETPAEGAAADWGAAVEGVQCRLEADKPTWQPAEMPTLKAYVRHQTETPLFLSNHPMFGAQLEVDGHWHRWNGPLEWTGPSHSSSKSRTKDQQPLAITLDENWRRVDNKEPLRVDPGRHVVRFAWEGRPEKGPREGPDEQRTVVLLSNRLEITVPPERPQPKLSDVHADDRHAATALQQLGAILAADDQGKIGSVRLSRTAVTDADLGHLKGLSGLKALYLDDTRITDTGLRHLTGLTGLETLSLNYTRVGNGGLEHLRGLKALRSLALLDTEVTATGLRGLKKALPELRATVDTLKLSGLKDLRAWRNSAKLNDQYELVSVYLLEANITDAELADLRKLTELHTLYLSGTRITDAGLECLKDMKKLRTLSLADTRIGDAGLARLSGLTNLESLLINGTQVTDAGMVHLKPLTKLTLLRLNDCQISGAGLSHLRDLTRLTTLELNGTAVSDTGLVHLQALVNLGLLYLSQTSVTDAGLDYLSGLKKLRMLEIVRTEVTDEGIQRLKQALPNTSIYR